MMGLCPPNDYYAVQNAVMASDTNFNGRISKMELFMLFKRIQNINSGMMMGGGMMGGGRLIPICILRYYIIMKKYDRFKL